MQLLLAGLLRHRLQLHGLRFPFAVATECLQGKCEVALPGRMQATTMPLLIWPLETVSVIANPGGRILFRTLAPANIEPVPRLSTPPRKPVTAALSLEIFRAPACDWQTRLASQAISVDGRVALSRRLLKEGECLRDIVLTQRVMRFLFDLTAGGHPLICPGRYGFVNRSRLEDALYDRFRLTPEMTQELAPSTKSCHALFAA